MNEKECSSSPPVLTASVHELQRLGSQSKLPDLIMLLGGSLVPTSWQRRSWTPGPAAAAALCLRLSRSGGTRLPSSRLSRGDRRRLGNGCAAGGGCIGGSVSLGQAGGPAQRVERAGVGLRMRERVAA